MFSLRSQNHFWCLVTYWILTRIVIKIPNSNIPRSKREENRIWIIFCIDLESLMDNSHHPHSYYGPNTSRPVRPIVYDGSVDKEKGYERESVYNIFIRFLVTIELIFIDIKWQYSTWRGIRLPCLPISGLQIHIGNVTWIVVVDEMIHITYLWIRTYPITDVFSLTQIHVLPFLVLGSYAFS
jgi:hypothetical protein